VKCIISFVVCFCIWGVTNVHAQPAKAGIDDYEPGPDSKPQSGVPKGKTFSFRLEDSKVFPGTRRNIAVYVPAQYKGDKPACVYVGLDSLGFGVPVVFDNLIHKGDMPITIAIGVSSGVVASATEAENPRFNRSFEFDGLNDSLARFIVEEVFPEVEKRQTPDGLPIKLSQDPNDRCAGGASTGGIGAFTLAWEHSGKHATAIFPDAMRFLWKDWPAPIRARTAETRNVLLKATLDPESSWQIVREAGDHCDHLAVNPQGEVFFHELANKRTRKLGTDGKVSDAANISADKAFAFAANGQAVTVDDLNATCVTTTSRGYIYATEADAGKVWLVRPAGSKTLLDEGLKRPTGIALSPDGLWLAVMESHTHWGYSYRVKQDGTVDLKQRFYWAHVPDWADDSGAGSMCMDRDGHPYVATHKGVQIFDRNGRSRGILPMPAGKATSVCFGGENLDTLFVTSGGKLYRRHMKAVGAPSFIDPIKLPPWGGG
jgi:sugar lactone lactonase YvrE